MWLRSVSGVEIFCVPLVDLLAVVVSSLVVLLGWTDAVGVSETLDVWRNDEAYYGVVFGGRTRCECESVEPASDIFVFPVFCL